MSTPTYPFVGSHSRAYYKTESTFGAFDAAAICYSLPWTSKEPSMSPNLLAVKTVGSDQYNALKKGMRRGDVRLAWALPSEAGVLIKECWNLYSVNLELLYYDEWAYPSNLVSLLFTGCRCNHMSVEAEASDRDDEAMLIRAAADFIAQKLTTAVAKQSSGTYNDALATAGKVFSDGYVKMGGAEMTECVGWRVDFNFNLKPVPVIRAADGDLMKYLQSRRKEVSADLSFDFESKARFDDVVNDTARTWEIGLGSAGHYVTLTDAKASLVSVPTKADDVLSCKVKLIPLSVDVARPY